jgi:hypothetical protein
MNPGMIISAPINEVFYPYSIGSVSAHIVNTIAGYISGKSPGQSTQNLYSAYGVRNQTLLTGALDLSAFNIESYVGAPVLVTPRHMITAGHIGAPTSVRFLKSDGSQVTHTVVASEVLMQDASPNPVSTDIRICLLQTPVTGVSPLKVPPADFYTKLPGGTYYGAHITDTLSSLSLEYLPMFRVEAHLSGGACLVIQGLDMLQSYVETTGKPVTRTWGPPVYTKNPEWQQWGEYVLPGDSGGVCFWPINGEPCLVGMMYSLASTNYGTEKRSFFFSPCIFATEINTIMRAQAMAYDSDATAYALTHQDWSGFLTV